MVCKASGFKNTPGEQRPDRAATQSARLHRRKVGGEVSISISLILQNQRRASNTLVTGLPTEVRVQTPCHGQSGS